MKHAIYIPLFGALAEPSAVVDIATAAEERGWDGLFVWDHVLSPIEGEWDLADPWVMLGAVAAVTTRIRLGTMVTPLPRRRVLKLARETVTLDRLSAGRLILGLGTGGDGGREFSAFGEPAEQRRLAQLLDDGTEALLGLWSGETVSAAGTVTVDNVRATPGPVQQPRIPTWFGIHRLAGRPLERAAAFDGVFPLGADVAAIQRISDTIGDIRGGDRTGFDIAVVSERGTDLATLQKAGATWAMHSFWPGHRPDQVLRFIDRGVPSV
jgi:alkanesulfonate monooxygenase SsuD/methylene tetrahydromethanopterin reductase-like flavin-dependent oxidoreductase (luciferase family)